MNPKFSIIIPTRNAGNYLQDCIESVISQGYTDYELIVSDNHSSDDTYDYVESLNNPNIRLIKPEAPLCMTDHYEWALKHALGDWVIIVGSDDGVMPYFFRLADKLIEKAEQKNIKVINSKRAYFFWDGCQAYFGDRSIIYTAYRKSKIKKCKFALLNATIGISDYIHLPQMYTTSIVHKDVVSKIKAKNNGVFYSSLIPDANGAAAICSVEEKYLESYIPLAWVGSSPKSNGLIFHADREKFKTNNSLNFKSSTIEWNRMAGEFNNGMNARTIDSFKMYLWESLLQTESLQKPFWAKLYHSKTFKTLLFANVFNQIKGSKPEEVVYLKEIASINKISFFNVKLCSLTISKLIWLILKGVDVFKQICDEIFVKKIRFKQSHAAEPNITLIDACKTIAELEGIKALVNGFIA